MQYSKNQEKMEGCPLLWYTNRFLNSSIGLGEMFRFYYSCYGNRVIILEIKKKKGKIQSRFINFTQVLHKKFPNNPLSLFGLIESLDTYAKVLFRVLLMLQSFNLIPSLIYWYCEVFKRLGIWLLIICSLYMWIACKREHTYVWADGRSENPGGQVVMWWA